MLSQMYFKELGFQGLIFTDALNMKASKFSTPGQIDLRAFLAGNDVLLFPEDAFSVRCF
jgi:beta-glucosidase-like glycosyl hydrolase